MMISEEIADEKTISTEVRYGFQPWLRSSGRRGEFIGWHDSELPTKQQKQSEEVW